jgi:RNA polymerase sigma-70 factor (ECF subfamily)
MPQADLPRRPLATSVGAMGPEPVAPGDAELVAGLKRGEPAAFETLVRAETGRCLATARRMLGCDEEARDAVQETFLSAFRAIASFQGNSRLGTWLHRILINTALMRLRSKRCRPEVAIEELLPSFSEDGHHLEPPLPWDKGVQADLLRSERRQLVRAAIERLPANYREVLMLRDIEGMSTEETARMLDATPNAVKIRLHRARQALRTLLDPHFRNQEP